MSNIARRLNHILQTVNADKVTDVAYKKFVDVTPEDKGNAKLNTKKSKNEINANYPYARVLDKGRHMTNKGMRGSNQAPKGMTAPTLEAVREYVYQQTGIRL